MGCALCNWGLTYWMKIFWTFGTIVTLSPSFANELVKHAFLSKEHHDGSKFLSQIEGNCWCQVLQHWAKIKQLTSKLFLQSLVCNPVLFEWEDWYDGVHEFPRWQDDLQMTSYYLKVCLKEPSRMLWTSERTLIFVYWYKLQNAHTIV
jgi:hypothetical protein